MLEALAKGQTPAAEIEAGLPQRADVNASSSCTAIDDALRTRRLVARGRRSTSRLCRYR
jgi:hypothetical protein